MRGSRELVLLIFKKERELVQRTSDDISINRRALDANIATSEERREDTSIESVAFLLYVVAAVELCITTGLYALFDSKVAVDIARVFDPVARVLALVSDLLVTLSVTPYRASHQGRGRYCKGESQDSNELLGKHFEKLWVGLRG